MTDEKKKRPGPFYEYLEIDLHGDSGVRENPKLGEGAAGWIGKLNAYARQGWRCIDLDSDTTVHKHVLLEREILEKDDG